MFNGLTINECLSWLNDVPRNSWYKEKICELVKDKVVFEVGCGSGLLAAYCLQYGAAHYYGIDIRSHRADYTRTLLDKMGFAGKHTVYSGNFLEFDDFKSRIDILLVEQTGSQCQNNFMIKQIWNHATELFPYEFISLPDQWEMDVELYQGHINNSLLPNQATRLLDHASLPANYYNAVQQLKVVQPLTKLKNHLCIKQNNCKEDISTTLDVFPGQDVTLVLDDYISFNGDRCYSSSAVEDWPVPLVIHYNCKSNQLKLEWCNTIRQAPHFNNGYWICKDV